MIFEFSVPRNRLLGALFHPYSFCWMPLLGRVICGTGAPFRYLAESVRVFPKPEEVAEMIRRAGFSDVSFRRLFDGLAVIYLGVEPGGTMDDRPACEADRRPVPALRHVQDRLPGDGALPVGSGEALRGLLSARADGSLPRAGRRPHSGDGSARRRRGQLHPVRHLRHAVPLRDRHAAGDGHAGAEGRHVGKHLDEKKPVLAPTEDAVLERLRAITGSPWATNDPAILFTYADDPFPLAGIRMPRYVVLPGSGTRSRPSSRWPTSSTCRSPYAATAAACSGSSSPTGSSWTWTE